jgi:hypothetical protein
MVDQDVGVADPAFMNVADARSSVADMRAYAWVIAILRMMRASAHRMADHLAREAQDPSTPEHDQYVRDSRELWDRYRHLIGIYEGVAWALPDEFKAQFAAWQCVFLASGARDAPADRASHYQASMARYSELVTAAGVSVGGTGRGQGRP